MVSLPFRVSWNHSSASYHTFSLFAIFLHKIDFSAFLSAVFSSGTYDDIFSAFIHSKAENNDVHFSNLIYISPALSDELFHNFTVLNNAEHKTYLYINDGSETPEFFHDAGSTFAVEADFEDISESLNKVVI